MPNIPVIPKTLDYPAAVTVVVAVVFTMVLLYFAGRFDPTGGVLTISLMVILTFIGVLAFSMFFTVPPNNEIIGGLIGAFGSVVTYWLTRPK